MNFKGIGHIALRAKKIDELNEFYVRQLGFKRIYDELNDDGQLDLVRYEVSSKQYIEIYTSNSCVAGDGYISDNKKCNRSHFHACFETNDRHKAINDLESKGLSVGRTIDDVVGLCKSYCQFVTDPEGNEWEIMEFTSESMQLHNNK